MTTISKTVTFPRGDASGLALLQQVRDELIAYENDIENVRQAELDAAAATGSLDTAMSKKTGSLGKASGAVEKLTNALGGGLAGSLLGIVNDAADVTKALGANGVSGVLSAVISPAGALTGALGLLVIGVSLLTAEYQRQQQVAKDTVDALQAETEARTRFYQELQGGGVEAANAVISQTDRLLQVQRNNVAAFERSIAELEARNQELDWFRWNATGLPRQDAVAEIDENNAKLEELRSRLTAANAEIERLSSGVGVFERMAIVIQDGIDRAQAAAVNQTRFTLGRAGDVLSRVGNTVRAFVDDFQDAIDDGLAAPTARFIKRLGTYVDAQDDAEDATERSSDSLKQLAGIIDKAAASADAASAAFNSLQSDVQRTVDRLDAERGKLSDTLRDTLKGLDADILRAQQDANADIAAEQQRFNDNQAAIIDQYRRSDLRAEVDFRREQARIRRQAFLDERRALDNNDVLAALDIRERKQEQLRQNREDFNVEKQRREEDLQHRLATEQTAHEARIRAINAALDAELAAINDRKAAAQEAADQQIAAIDRQKKAALDALTAVAQARQAADDAALLSAERVKQAWQQVAYPGGPSADQHSAFLNSVYGTSPGGAPLDPFNLPVAPPPGALPPPGGPVGGSSGDYFHFDPGAIVIGDVASKQDVSDALTEAINGIVDRRQGKKP